MRCLLILSIIALSNLTANAQLVLEQHIKSTIGGDKVIEKKAVVKFKGEYFRVETWGIKSSMGDPSALSSIFISNKKGSYSCRKMTKTCSKSPPISALSSGVAQAGANLLALDIKSLRKKGKVMGYACDYYRITRQFDSSPKPYDTVGCYSKAFFSMFPAEAVAQMKANNMKYAASPKLRAKMEQEMALGLPLKFEMKIDDKSAIHYRLKITSIKKAKVSDSEFKIPKGYKMRTLPTVPGMPSDLSKSLKGLDKKTAQKIMRRMKKMQKMQQK